MPVHTVRRIYAPSFGQRFHRSTGIHRGFRQSGSAQRVLGVGDDALVLPRGVFRFRTLGQWTWFNERYGKDTPGRPDGAPRAARRRLHARYHWRQAVPESRDAADRTTAAYRKSHLVRDARQHRREPPRSRRGVPVHIRGRPLETLLDRNSDTVRPHADLGVLQRQHDRNSGKPRVQSGGVRLCGRPRLRTRR